MTIIAAADGSALGNPGPAGWAWYVDEDRWAAGGWAHGTNNMGELTAVLELLRATADSDEDLLVLCDSLYAINSITKWMAGWKRKGWKKGDGKPVLNLDIIKALDEAMKGRQVRFEWIKGHSGHDLNEAADRLANGAAQAFKAGVAVDAGPGFGGGATSTRAVANETSETDPRHTVEQSIDERPFTSAEPPRGLVEPMPGTNSDDVAEAGVDDPDDADLFDFLGDEGVDDPHLPDLSDLADIDQVLALERALLSPGIRADAAQVAALLHPEWTEIGRSGRLWTRDELLDQIAPLNHSLDLDVVATHRIGPDTILLVWRSGPELPALRSSLWVRDGGSWRQLFHQGTPAD